MKHLLKIMLAASVLLSLTIPVNAQKVKKLNEEQTKTLSAFPEATSGMVRHVIFLNKKSNEDLFKVEIMPGKVMNVDCNRHSLMGKLEEKDLQGWGYTYFEFTSNGQTRSTMMACNKPNEDRFIYGQTQLVRYNSKLPIVVYAPAGYEIKYRIWKAGKEMNF
ncbi:serine protease inhibitor ecotin [Bacteroides sp. 519]|uniref:serine protease inhibitor ecotin n=1 Tax=Bacteroides sp. 519 TaxID=2302937 RepID=UPI0013D30269|nr:serine protease inhibitor ecotin [Bacteroides sp. 519]NDV59823.1 ecotin [Bacteroides sp. 519]